MTQADFDTIEASLPETPRKDFTIASYDARFYGQVVALVTSIQQQELGGGVTFEEQHDLQDIPGTFLRNNGHFWLALSSEAVIGTVGLIDLGNNTGALKKMFVAEPYRGRELAVAQKLFDKLLRWVRAHGFRHLYLGTGPTLLAAHRFYERNGFCEITNQPIPPEVLATLVRVDTKRYYKAIA